MKGVAWDSMFLAIVKIVTTLTAIAQTKILSVGLSLQDYGTYSQANVVVSLCTSVLLLGLVDAINYFYNDASHSSSKEKKNSIINTIYGIELVAGIVLWTLLILCRGGIASYFSNEALTALLLIIAIKPMFDNMIYFYQVLFVSTGKAKVIAIRNLIISFCKLIAIAIAVKVFSSIKMIYISLIILDLLQLVIFALLFNREGFKINPLKSDFKYIKPILNYGIPMGIFVITTSLTRDIDKLIIGYMADTETVAVYANCSKILPLDIIVVSFATVLIPYIMKYISGGMKEKSIKLFNNYLKLGYYSVWTFGVAILLVTNQAISFLYSTEYIQGKSVFIIYIFDSMVKFASMHLILTASGNSKLLMRYSLISLILNTVLNICLFKLMGIIGPALSTLIVTSLYTAAILKKTTSVLGAKWKQIFDIKDILTFVAGLVIIAIIFNRIDKLLLGMGMNQYIAMILSMAGFGIVVLGVYFRKIKNVLQSINSLRI